MLTSYVKVKVDSIIHDGNCVKVDDLRNLSASNKYTDLEICTYLLTKVNKTFREGNPLKPKQLSRHVYLILDYLELLKENDKLDAFQVGEFLQNITSSSYMETVQLNTLKRLQELCNLFYPALKEAQAEKKDDFSKEKVLTVKQEEKILKKYEKLESKYQEVIKERNTLKKENTLLSKKAHATEVLMDEAKKTIQEHKNYDLIRSELTRNLELAQEQIQELTLENKELFEKNSLYETNLEEKYKDKENKKQRETSLDMALTDYFLEHAKQQFTLKELMNEMVSCSGTYSLEEINDSLKRIGKTWFIESKHYKSNPPKYGIIPVESDESTIHYNFDCSNCIDVLLISDLHFTEFDASEQYLIDEVYRYCREKHIETIFNLGDLFSADKLHVRNKKEGYDLLSHIKLYLDMLPKDTSIKQYILGGNHDEDYMEYGLDPLTLMEQMDSHIVSLGYINATIRFNNLPSNNIKLIHDSRRGEVTSVFEEPDTYFKLYGHTHLGEMDTASGYAVVPSLHVDKRRNGCYRMLIEFHEDGRIERIQFYELSFGPNGLEDHIPVTFAKEYPVKGGKNKTLQKKKSCDKINK